MKVVINLQNPELLNTFLQTSKETSVELINAKAENVLFSQIEQENINYYIFDTESSYVLKAISFIKKTNHNAIVYLISQCNEETLLYKCDIYAFYDSKMNKSVFAKSILITLESINKNLSILYKLTQKSDEVIKFGNASYDPSRRILSFNNKQIKHLSSKQGGVLELLAQNMNVVIKKEVILAKVWNKNDYYASRSLDVYVTSIRKIFDDNNMGLKITNITGKGLVLEK